MRRFTALYQALDATTRTREKVEALRDYFRAAPALDAAWAVYVLSGRKIGRAVSSGLLRAWAADASGHPAWLVDQCYRTVGDLSETLALLVPGVPGDHGDSVPSVPLHEVIEQRLRPLASLPRERQRALIVATWAQLTSDERLVFHKLLGGNFRVGVSRPLLVRALAEVAGVAPAAIAHRLAGDWRPGEAAMARLLAPPGDGAAGPAPDAGVPYPFMLAHPLPAADGLASLGPIGDWLVEWKWDGIRAQVIRRGGRTTLWSRGDEDVSGAFPEVVQAGAALPDGTVLDGEIVGWDAEADRPLPFTALQRRLNRRSVELTFWPDVPVAFVAFDLLEAGGRDIRALPLSERRELLASTLVAAPLCPTVRPSLPLASCDAWDDVTRHVEDCRQRGVEGVMLKRRAAAYQPGRPTGAWWKLKVAPFTLDAVLIAAEPGRGRRAGLLTDYTFGVWDGVGADGSTASAALVPIAKAYSGLTDAEIVEVDRFIRRHTTARHGPVHAVEPQLVFELGFEAIQASPRHKSGVALRFPRMLRMRRDKRPEEADRLGTVRALLVQQAEARR